MRVGGADLVVVAVIVAVALGVPGLLGAVRAGRVLMANALGEKDDEMARRIFAQALVFATVTGVVLSAAGLVVAGPLFRLLGAEGDYLAVSMEYMRVILYGGVFFILQLALNAAWTPIFFGAHQLGWALVEIVALWVAILLTLLSFRRVNTTAGWLFVPYLAWVTFATVLNFTLWKLNPA